MNPNLLKSKLSVLQEKQDKNDVNLDNKIEKTLFDTSISSEYISTGNLLFDSGWFDSDVEEKNGATTLIENTLLPQKALFEQSLTLEVPEVYLPYFEFEIFTRPIDQQAVQGAGKFTFNGLQEVLLTLYKWNGVTYHDEPTTGWSGYTTGPIAVPPIALPEPSLILPPPTSCYTKQSYWTHITVNGIGGGPYGYDLTPDGLWVIFEGGTLVSLIDFTTNIWNTWHPILVSLTFTAGQSYTFNYPANYFPVPDGATLPCGSTTAPSGWPDQRWESEGQFTFFEYMSLGYTYSQAKALFTKYYPEIFITPETNGIPYKAYRRVETDVVDTARKLVQITKLDKEKFKIDISGYVLLISPANYQPSWSDPDFPTFQPTPQSLSMRLMVYFKGHPVNFRKTKEYNNDKV